MQLVFETNFWGPVRVFQAALPLFPKTGETSFYNPVACDQGLTCLLTYRTHISEQPLVLTLDITKPAHVMCVMMP